MLVKTIRVLLNDRNEQNTNFLTRFINHIWCNIFHWFCPLKEENLSKAFYKHPTIKYLAQSSWKSKPSYIGSYNFSTTLIKLLRGPNYDGSQPQMNAIHQTLFESKKVVSGETGNTICTTIDPETLTQLKGLYLDAQGDIDKFKALLERWFEETMERAVGWYKKQTQYLLLITGFLIAYNFNADSIAIGRILGKDKTARENMVMLATGSTSKYKAIIDSIKIAEPASDSIKNIFIHLSDDQLRETNKIIRADVDNANLIIGLGWPDEDGCKTCDTINIEMSKVKGGSLKYKELKANLDQCRKRFYCIPNPYQKAGLQSFIGWFLTALAISFGAPFWFDLLNKVIQLRSSVAKPKATDTGGGSSKINDGSNSANNRVG